ncbi:GNAT family N-acetyltransferase [Kitasatospora sp. NBC_00240]|uniref:GNAT family N-acetyltransferase n=1 Tax=Kitasatospora sp. NBC_00240 TaxID=2903567 RepID=UPI00225BB220|nr:GNAT family N-acetyltransferase [Kitasatospora sp. NBC_00240]MCX5211047.1 GNAT family N-acetyltransferase [Kitasatospora sp. NBC_00240]
MAWTLSTSLDDFRTQAGGFLAAHPVENTVLLSVAARLATDGLGAYGEQPPRFGWWRPVEGGPVEGAYLQTPPYHPRLGLMPAAAGAALARAFAESGAFEAGALGSGALGSGVLGVGAGRALGGVGGGKAAVRQFAAAWCAATGRASAVQVDERLHRLAELVPPSPAPTGLARAARAAERELLIGWFEDFGAEIAADFHAGPEAVDRRIADGTLHVWEDGGRPVAVAGRSPVVAGMSRIGPVFTPPALRGRGYGGAVTAAASAYALAEGAGEVLLYTDLANPTSNSIYRKLGYRPVEDCLAVAFHD